MPDQPVPQYSPDGHWWWSTLLLMCLCAVAVASCQDAQQGARAAASTPRASALTNQPTQREIAASYTRAVQADAAAAASGFSSVQTGCGSGGVDSCRSALRTLQTNLGIFQQDLDAHPAPPCLKATDLELRQALALYQQGAQLGVDGIDQGNASKISQGGDLMSQANAHMQHATALVNQASC